VAVIEHPAHGATIAREPAVSGRDAARRGAGGHAARAALRAQIGRLERQLADLAAATYPHLVAPPTAAAAAAAVAAAATTTRPGPRILTLGELERVRDELAMRLADLRVAAVEQAEQQAGARDELRAMVADPRAYRGRRVRAAELGVPGCTVYASRPRLGLIGMLAGWWHVTVSSGCPIGCGP
jgi:hypothetical protein